METLDVLSRWIHVGTAVALVGGAVFNRCALLPALGELDAEAASRLKAGVQRRWKLFVHVGIVLLLISGVYNLVAVGIGDKVPLYHALIGVKILLAFAVFFLAEALVGRSEAFQKFRDNARFWIGVLLLVAFLVIAIAGYLKVQGTALNKDADAAAVVLDGPLVVV